MSTTALVTVVLQFSSIGMFVVGLLYFIAGEAATLSARIPVGIAVLVGALMLFGMAEAISILSDIRRAVEGTAESPEPIRGRRVTSTPAGEAAPPIEAVPEAS